MRPKRFLSLPVLAVLLLMMFVYYTTIFVFIDGSFDLQSSNGTFNAAIFTILASFSIFSFFVCVLSDPGHVPSSYVPDVEGQGSAKDNAERKKCDKCYGYKPPRTHHCRVCKKCVLKMDHHCLWINNCVGYWNYKAFFVFTSYATLASIHSMILFICSIFLMDKGSSSKMFYSKYLLLVSLVMFFSVETVVFVVREYALAIFGIGLLLLLAVYTVSSHVMYGTMAIGLTTTLLTLFGWHVYLILHNMTTIEYYEGKRAKWLAMKSGQSYRHPFNISPYKNITSVLGPNMLKWLCPTAVSHLKEGVSFPTLRDSS